MIFEGDVTPQQILEQLGGYQALIPDDVMIDHEGKSVSIKSLPDIQNAKDLGALAKGYVESQREIGRRERVPGKDAKPEELSAFRAKLVDRGLLPTPIADPKDYGITRPETVAEVFWNEELATGLATLLHKYQVPKEAAAELLTLHERALNGAQQVFTMTAEQGEAALRQEFGDRYDQLAPLAGRLAKSLFKTPEELAVFEHLHLANNPLFLAPLLRLAPLAQQDSSFMRGMEISAGPMSTEAAVKEHTAVMSDPKHPHYAGYRKGDPAALAYVDALYRKPGA